MGNNTLGRLVSFPVKNFELQAVGISVSETQQFVIQADSLCVSDNEEAPVSGFPAPDRRGACMFSSSWQTETGGLPKVFLPFFSLYLSLQITVMRISLTFAANEQQPASEIMLESLMTVFFLAANHSLFFPPDSR